MSEHPRSFYRLMYAGLLSAIVANVLLIVMQITEWHQYGMFAPNLVAAVVCAGAWWLIRQRQKGRL